MSEDLSNMLFQAPSSFFDPSFWEELYNRKLHIYKLESKQLGIHCSIKCSNGKNSESFEFSRASFVNEKYSHSGNLLNVNTIEEFRDSDKKSLIESAAVPILRAILSGIAIKHPETLTQFILLTFADLKSYKFTYWLGVPTILPENPFLCSGVASLRVHSVLLVTTVYKAIKTATSTPLPSIFAIYHPVPDSSNEHTELSFCIGQPLTLEQVWSHLFHPHIFILTPDSSSADNNFGWSVRNFLALVAISAGITALGTRSTDSAQKSIRLIGLRGSIAKRVTNSSATDSGLIDLLNSMSIEEMVSTDNSIISTVKIDHTSFASLLSQCDIEEDASSPLGYKVTLKDEEVTGLKVVGWEANERGKPGPRTADLSNTLDGRYLMAQAVDLNLSLMKWRMWPELDTARLANTKCLLLGAGTLGCAVARSLLGWGVRNITLVDSGRVSYSNPARQCLFEYEDCVNKRYKAEAAAERLKRIFPDVNASGVVLNIPMPGHPMLPYSSGTTQSDDSSGSVNEDSDYHTLKALIDSHDVVFALTDSREARWLPTAMCASENKILLNVALGFDSYLVMRHGHGYSKDDISDDESSSTARLGCYFCNDIVAATNSTRDRTLDQQCTVTRPGLSFIAAALCVEMMVAILHSKHGSKHPVPSVASTTLNQVENEEEKEVEEEVVIPHQIRGSLTGFTQFLPQTPAFVSCTACSLSVVKEYRENGVKFVRAVCEDSKVLETVSGVANLMSEVDLDDCVDSDEEF